MTRTKPPCYDTKTGTDCPRRMVGCKIECKEWIAYQAIHETEREEIMRKRKTESEANEFAVRRALRRKRAEQERFDQRR